MAHSLIDRGPESERNALLGKNITSQEPGENSSLEPPFRSSRKVAYTLAVIAVVTVTVTAVVLWLLFKSRLHSGASIDPVSEVLHDSPSCKQAPYFSPVKIQVESRASFPSFLDYGNKGAFNISYDSRSILMNDERVILLGGSLHPSRATKETWDHALDEVVLNGLNLITVYVMWEDHQPVPTKDIDWSFPKGVQFDDGSKSTATDWSLASAIRSAARRGLFVHIRIGPYDCAEYSYGGIPEYIPLQYPNIEMRRPNLEWLQVMRSFVEKMVDYLDENELWAHQGGPIILGQIENELGGEVDPVTENLLLVDPKGEFVIKQDDVDPTIQGLRSANLQDYADWCGKLVEELAPNVTWVRPCFL
jgi:hypothetical protein